MQSKKDDHKEKDDLKQDKQKAAFPIKSSSGLELKSIKMLSQSSYFEKDIQIECYKILCNANRSGYWIFDHKNETLWLSDELLSIFNIAHNEQTIIQAIENQLFQNEDVDTFFTGIQNFIDDKANAEFSIRLKDNKSFKFLHNTLSTFTISNDKEIIVGIIKDITKQIQYEEELAKQKEKAIESDRIKSAFLKNISHEIRTPMNSVIGFIELLDNKSFQEEKKQEFLTIIKSKSKQLLSLIDDIAELSKFESGDIGISKTETNLVKIFQELHHEYSEKAAQIKNNIEIFLNLPVDINEHQAYTDPGRIQQVLSYFLDNALKYTEKGYIQLGYEIKDNKQIVLYVKDTGIGISKESQKYLFNRFRINEDTVKHSNTGLGLTISRAIVEQLGGKISVESSPGQGSVFSFTIPFQKIEKVALHKKEEEFHIKPNWRNKVIIVAEDDEVNFHFLEAVLADTQVRLIHVHNGKQAVEICHTLTNIDLILMDIRMPEKSGHEAVKEIKKFRKEIPIIAQTAYTGKEEREKCLKAGCDDYISKPIDISLLINKINYFLAD